MSSNSGILARAAKEFSHIEAHELKTFFIASLFVFILVASYSKQELEAEIELGLG